MKPQKHPQWIGKRLFLGFNLGFFLFCLAPQLYSYPPLYYSPNEEMNTTTVAFSPDGKYILSAGFHGDFRLWETGRCELQGIGFIHDPRLQPIDQPFPYPHYLSHRKNILSLVWSPNGENFALGIRDQTVRMYSFHPNPERYELFDEQAVFQDDYQLMVRAVAYSPDGRFIASGGHDGYVFLWKAEKNGSNIGRFCCHSGMVNTLDFSPDGRFLLSGSSDQTIKVWETHSGNNLRTLEMVGEVYSVAFSPDGRIIAASSWFGKKSSIVLWDRETGKEERKLIHPDGSWSIRFSPNGEFLASGGYEDEGKIMIWKVQSGEHIQTLVPPEPGKIRSLSYSPDGHYLVSGHTYGPLPLWDLKTGKIIREFGKCPK